MIAPETYKKAPAVQLLPSANSAIALARGEPGALWAVLGHTAARALVMAPAGIAAGAVVGVRPGAAVAIVIGAAIGIEIGIIALAMRQAKAQKEAVLLIEARVPPDDAQSEPQTPVEQAKADKTAAKDLPGWLRGEKAGNGDTSFAWA